MSSDVASKPMNRSPKILRGSIWVVQWFLAVTFVGGGIWKFATPIEQLAAMIPWAGQVSPHLLYATATFDILGGLGVLLPSITRVMPRVALVAAIGCAALQACAIIFHFGRGEGADTPFNFLMLALSLFVFWGRRSRVPIRPRG